MITNSSPRESLTARFLGQVLPKRMKRLIFVSSFIAHIKNSTNPDKELLSKINKLLLLSSNDDALLLPVQLHQQIWQKVVLKDVLTDKNIEIDDISQIASYSFKKPQIRTLSEEIIRVIPNWLLYGSKTQIRSDLICIFQNMDILLKKD